MGSGGRRVGLVEDKQRGKALLEDQQRKDRKRRILYLMEGLKTSVRSEWNADLKMRLRACFAFSGIL